MIEDTDENRWKAAKHIKKQFHEWTLMDPNQVVPSGTSDRHSFFLRQLLNKLWLQGNKKDLPRPASYEPAKTWPAYVVGVYWEHSHLRPQKKG